MQSLDTDIKEMKVEVILNIKTQVLKTLRYRNRLR
jgi:hypothetical protein